MQLLRGMAYLLGLCFTIIVLSVVILLSPFLLLYRLIKYWRDKLILPVSCDVLWPRPPFTRAFIWLSNTVDKETIEAILNNQPMAAKLLCFVPTPLAPVEVMPWDHQKHPMYTHDDFLTYVREKLDHIPYAAQVKIVSGYDFNNLGRTLLVVKSHPDSYQLCMLRILAALSHGNVSVEVEPRVFYECVLENGARFKGIRRALDYMGTLFTTISYGPFSLLLNLQLKPEKVWRALVAETHQVFAYRRRPSLLVAGTPVGGGADSETSKLCISSSVQLKPQTTACFTVTEIGDFDELQKVERLLRATMAELLTSFLAGALRRYFRESDPAVLHPPDCRAAFAVCSCKAAHSEAAAPCSHLLLPISLPIGVEGRIPRLWCLQQQFSRLQEDCVPQALTAFNAISRALLPRNTHEKVANVFFRHAVLNIAYLRVHGDVMLDSNVLTRFLPIPPLTLPSRASFVFVQQADKILLVSSIDRGLFDRHQDIFKYMQEEQRGLLSHLSFRLRTLTQTCVLPERLPSEEEEGGLYHHRAPPDAPANSPSGERAELLLPDAAAAAAAAAGPCCSRSTDPAQRSRRASTADLNELLREVQEELDEMRRNPNVDDRDATIRRLRELEAKIETFHNGMKSELWGNTVWVRQEKDEAMKKVAELLAPYQRRVSVSGRRLSRRASKEYAILKRGSVDITTRRGSSETRREEESRGPSEEKTEEVDVEGDKKDEEKKEDV